MHGSGNIAGKEIARIPLRPQVSLALIIYLGGFSRFISMVDCIFSLSTADDKWCECFPPTRGLQPVPDLETVDSENDCGSLSLSELCHQLELVRH